MCHVSKETSGRPSDNEKVNQNEPAIDVYMGRNDLRLVVLRMYDSNALYVVTVCPA